MRLTDLEAWVEQQFLDTNPAPVEEPEPEPEPEPDAGRVGPTSRTLAAPPVRPAPAQTEDGAPDVRRHLRPTPADEVEIPSIERYLPFLKGSGIPEQPEPTVAEAPAAEAVPEEAAQPAAEAGVLEDAAVQDTPVAEPEAAKPADTAAGHSQRVRPRPRARNVPPPELAPPRTGEQFWQLAPRHVRTLIAMGQDDAVQGSYKRQFKESRLALIERLLDPTLSLEDTARLLNVCPTTVRRYTNRGLLRHQRTAGDQRRFKLSDVLSFMEAQSSAKADHT